MKKQILRVFALLLCLAMVFSLVGCGKSEYVKNAEALIDAIGEVTVDSEEAIAAAEKAYDALTEEDKAKVENADLLAPAREALEKALEEKAAAELEALRQSMIGTWRTDMDMSQLLAEYVDGTGELPVQLSGYIDEMMVSYYMCFYEDNTYRFFCDEDSLRAAFDSIRPGLAAYYLEIVRQALIETLSEQDPNYDFTAEGAVEAYIEASLEEALKNSTGLTVDELLDQVISDEMISTVLESSSMEGMFTVEPGKLHLSRSLTDKPVDGDYESFTLENNLLTLTSYSGTSVLGDVYPITFVRQD